MKLWSIILLTFRESLAKKTFMAFLGISTFICLLLIFALNLDIVNGMQSSVSLFGQDIESAAEISKILFGIESGIAVLLFSGGIFMSLFATSSLVPSLLQEGYIDIFISKPVSRLDILLGRYVGAIVIVALNIFYLVIFSGAILSIKTGIWNWGYLWAGVIIVLTFGALFALMTFLSVLSRSGPLSLMITYLVLFFSPMLLARDKIYALLSSPVYGYFFDGLYYFLPKTAELGVILQKLVSNQPVESWMPLWSSMLFAVFMLAVTGYIFQKKNF